MDAVGVRAGAVQGLVQVDSGAVPVGRLVCPEREAADPTQELTPLRRLPNTANTNREVRVALAWSPARSTTR